MIVADASVLIFLAKLGHLDLLRRMFKQVLVPRSVWEEVVPQTRRTDFPEIRVLEEASSAGWLAVAPDVTVRDPVPFTNALHAADDQVLLVARAKRIRRILADDAPLRRAARSLGIAPIGTIGILMEAASLGVLTRREARDALERLPTLGFRASHDLLLRFLRELGA